MPRVHFVKKARKPNPVAEIGEPYYWWKFRYGGKRFSKTHPKQSQLTQSEFLGRYYAIQEGLNEGCYFTDFDTLNDGIETLRNELEELMEETQEKLDNMPEQLQDSETGQLLQERIDNLDSWISELDNIDVPDEDDLKKEIEENEEMVDCPSCNGEGDPECPECNGEGEVVMTEEKAPDEFAEKLEELKLERFEEIRDEVSGADPGIG